MAEINQWRGSCLEGANPRDYKVLLAQEIIERFHSAGAAKKALQNFEARFRHGALPDDLVTQRLKAADSSYAIANLLKDAGLTNSTTEAYRMLKQGAVRIDGERISDSKLKISSGTTHIYQIGKRKFAKITVG